MHLRSVVSVVLMLVGGIAFLAGVAGLGLRLYEVFLANLFAGGTMDSPYVHYSVPDRVRLVLECAAYIAFGLCWLIAGWLARKKQTKPAAWLTMAGVLAALGINGIWNVLYRVGL